MTCLADVHYKCCDHCMQTWEGTCADLDNCSEGHVLPCDEPGCAQGKEETE